jgi:hypothetical protein
MRHCASPTLSPPSSSERRPRRPTKGEVRGVCKRGSGLGTTLHGEDKAFQRLKWLGTPRAVPFQALKWHGHVLSRSLQRLKWRCTPLTTTLKALKWLGTAGDMALQPLKRPFPCEAVGTSTLEATGAGTCNGLAAVEVPRSLPRSLAWHVISGVARTRQRTGTSSHRQLRPRALLATHRLRLFLQSALDRFSHGI